MIDFDYWLCENDSVRLSICQVAASFILMAAILQ